MNGKDKKFIQSDGMETAGNRMKGASLRTKLVIIVIVAVLFTVSFPIICNLTGSNFGNTVGTAVGSFYAVTKDMPEAYSQGVGDGLSARDVQVELRDKVKQVGKLVVLAGNVTLTDLHKVGEKYAALYSLGADVMFSVDLSKASVFIGDSQTIIKVPRPEVVLNIDSTKTRLEADWQRLWFNGSSEDGITAFMNSMKNIQNEAEKSIQGYDTLEKQAEAATVRQVTMLAEMMIGDGNSVEVQFMGKGGEDNEGKPDDPI